MLVLNLPAFKNKKYTAYDHFHGNSLYGRIPPKKEPIRMFGFTSRLPNCHIINSNNAAAHIFHKCNYLKLAFECLIFWIFRLKTVILVMELQSLVREMFAISLIFHHQSWHFCKQESQDMPTKYRKINRKL